MTGRLDNIRLTKKQRIYCFFADNLLLRFRSDLLHAEFGTAFRSRVSDINRDPVAKITIHNQTTVEDGSEKSVYWAARRQAAA